MHITDNNLYVTNSIISEGGGIPVKRRTIASIAKDFELPKMIYAR